MRTFDVVPAVARNGSESFDGVRARVMDGTLFIWADHRGKVALVRKLPVTEARRDGRKVIATTEDGGTWTISPGNGCACGSPLRRPYSRLPTEVS